MAKTPASAAKVLATWSRSGREAMRPGRAARRSAVGGVELDRHVGQHQVDGLEFADRLAELLALWRMDAISAPPADAERHRGRADALAVVGGHQLSEAAGPATTRACASGTRQPSKCSSPSRDPRRPIVGSRRPMRKPGRARGTSTAPIPARPGIVEAREDEVEVALAGAGDPALVAVRTTSSPSEVRAGGQSLAAHPRSGSVMAIATSARRRALPGALSARLRQPPAVEICTAPKLVSSRLDRGR